MAVPTGAPRVLRSNARCGSTGATLWALFTLLTAGSVALLTLRPDRLSDLHIYRGALLHMQAGRPLYDFVADNGGPFTYPPFAALVLWPVAALPEGLAQAGWLALTCLAVIAIAVSVGRLLTEPGPRRRLVVPLIGCALMLSAPVQSNLRFGQVSIFIVLLALVDATGAVPARLRGVLVGIAAAIKLTPLLFVVYFLAVGRYRDAGRATAAFVACAAVGVAVLPAESMTFWTEALRETSRIATWLVGQQSMHGMLLGSVSTRLSPVLWAALVAIPVPGGVAARPSTRPRRRPDTRGAGRLRHRRCVPGLLDPPPELAGARRDAAGGGVGVARRVAGVALLTAMVVSLGVVLAPVSARPGVRSSLRTRGRSASRPSA